MSTSYLASNRFGLGRRFNDAPVEDAQAWLTHQLDAFDPRPPVIAALPGREAIAADFVAYQDNSRTARQSKKRRAETNGMASSNEDRAAQDAELVRLGRSAIRGQYLAAANARLTNALSTDTDFPERLVHFWSNHFAVSADKLPVIGFAGNFEFEAIRPHIMGRFSDLLTAAVRHPAMLLFLDQAVSFGPDSPIATRQKRRQGKPVTGLNENLAREIMELHTLGVRTGYSQTDVRSFAKALTGLTIAGLGRGPGQRLMPPTSRQGETVFIAALHEPGSQTILGKIYGQSGPKQAEAILRDLAAHPATARHIATQLACHFSSDDPAPALVDRLASNFLATGGDLPSLYRTLIASPEPWDRRPGKFKSPWDWAVSMLRGLNLKQIGKRENAVGLFTQLGQPLWRPGSPAGFSDTVDTWAGSAALMRRVELASRVASRTGDSLDARLLAPLLLGDALDTDLATAIARADSPGQGLAMLLVSPAFLRR